MEVLPDEWMPPSPLAPTVAHSLAVLLDAADIELAELPGLLAPQSHLPTDETTRLGEVIRAAEAVKSFADSVQLQAIEHLTATVMADVPPMVDPVHHRERVRIHHAQSRDAVARETAMLTGRPITECRDRVRVASAAGDRFASCREALRAGATTWERVRTVAQQTAHVDPATADHIAARALAPSRARLLDLDGLFTLDPFGGVPVSHAGFRTRLAKQLALVEQADERAQRTKAEKLAARDTRADMLPFGMAALTIDGTAERVQSAMQRVDHLARAARAGGDPRTMNQLRSDIATDLLIHGTVPNDATLGAPPPVRLNVFVSLDTLAPAPASPDRHRRETAMGCGDTAFGPLAADVCRRLLFTEGTVLRRLITDPSTGQVIDAAATYRVPASMAALVTARDQTSRAPGQETRQPRHALDLDHVTNWSPAATSPAAGQTHPDNLSTLDRGSHNLKTRGFWSAEVTDAGAITWRTLTTTVATFPFDTTDESLLTPAVDPLQRTAAQLSEDTFGSQLMTPDQSAFATAALGGPAPAVPSAESLAQQDAADAIDRAEIEALNAGGCEPPF